MTEYVFEPAPVRSLEIVGQTARFPVRRIFCVGRNYAAHAAEMGGEVDREAPWYFNKSAHALCQSGATIALPPETSDCHYEMEFVVALGGDVSRGSARDALASVFGFGCGIDLTRRDLQAAAKATRRPWDTGKDFENAAILAPLVKSAAFGEIAEQAIWLEHNGEIVQKATLAEMVWRVPEIIAHLSRFYHLQPGDLIMTGTPAGVGPVSSGSQLRGGVDGVPEVTITFANA